MESMKYAAKRIPAMRLKGGSVQSEHWPD
jgi:hypothetical protein